MRPRVPGAWGEIRAGPTSRRGGKAISTQQKAGPRARPLHARVHTHRGTHTPSLTRATSNAESRRGEEVRPPTPWAGAWELAENVRGGKVGS